MEPGNANDIKTLLVEVHALAKDNHRMLRAIRRDAWFTFFGHLAIWVLVLVLPFYLYWRYGAPLLSRLEAATGSKVPLTLPSLNDIQKLLDSYRANK